MLTIFEEFWEFIPRWNLVCSVLVYSFNLPPIAVWCFLQNEGLFLGLLISRCWVYYWIVQAYWCSTSAMVLQGMLVSQAGTKYKVWNFTNSPVCCKSAKSFPLSKINHHHRRSPPHYGGAAPLQAYHACLISNPLSSTAKQGHKVVLLRRRM